MPVIQHWRQLCHGSAWSHAYSQREGSMCGMQAWVSPWQVAHVLSIIKAVHEAIPPVDPIWEQVTSSTFKGLMCSDQWIQSHAA